MLPVMTDTTKMLCSPLSKPPKGFVLPNRKIKIGFFGKGGTGKSTGLAHVIAHLKKMDLPTVAFDTDEPGEKEEGSLYSWHRKAPLGAPVYPAPAPGDVRHEIDRLTPEPGIGLVDTGAWERRAGNRQMAALSAVDLAVLFMQPTDIEVERIGSIFAAVEQIESVGGRTPQVVVLLTMVNNRAYSPGETREALVAGGTRVLKTEIPRSDALDGYAQSFGKPPRLKQDSPMHQLASELLMEGIRSHGHN